MNHKILLLLLLLNLKVIHIFAQLTSQQLDERYNDAQLAERNRAIQEKNEASYWEFISGGYLKSMEVRQTLLQANFQSISDHLMKDLYHKKDLDLESRYLLSYLTLFEPRLLTFCQFSDYTLQTAKKNLVSLALESNHAGAQYDVAEILLKENPGDKEGWDLMEKAARQHHFHALQKMRKSSKLKKFDNAAFNETCKKWYGQKNAREHIEELCELAITPFANSWDYTALMDLTKQNGYIEEYVKTLLWQHANKKRAKPVAPILKIFPFGNNNTLPGALSFNPKLEKEIMDSILMMNPTRQALAWEMLGDIYSGKFFYNRKETNYFFNYFQNFQKSIDYYTKSYHKDNKDVLFKLAMLYKSGPDTIKDLKKAFTLLSNLADQEYVKAYSELGDCYESGKGTPANPEKANIFFKKGLTEYGDENSLSWLARQKEPALYSLYPANMWLEQNDFLKDLTLMDFPVKVVHFWHQGFNAEEYTKTIELMTAFKNNDQVKMVFACPNDPSDISGLAKAMRYKGVVYGVRIPTLDTFKAIHQQFEKKVFGFDAKYSYEYKILDNIGTVHPEFDNRWTALGMPATFVYLKEEKTPHYFNAATPTEAIIRFVKEKQTLSIKK